MFNPQVSRRDFLRGLAALSSLSVYGPLAALPACEDENPRSLGVLQQLLPGKVLVPGDPAFAQFTTPWNLRWAGVRPVASVVARAESTDDVQLALRWARGSGTPVVARSGGHSYTGYSTTTGLVIDVSQMTSVSFDPSTGIATVGGGARNRNVYSELEKVGHTVTHGRCYGVGVAGLVLGGGIGFNMRRIGVTSDQLIGTDVVLADGSLVRADANNNPELFWACRGAGGGQFGIHTSFTFQTHVAPDVIVFDLSFTEPTEALLQAIVDAAIDAPRELGLKITVRATRSGDSNTLVINLLGQYAGALSDFEAWLAPIEAVKTPDPARNKRLALPYWTAQQHLSEEGPAEFMYERSRFIRDPLGAAAIGEIFARLRAWPGTKAAASWKGFLTGGAIRDVAADATAYVHRSDWLLSTVDLNWTHDDSEATALAALEWVDETHEGLARFGTSETYQNFIDDSQLDWPTAYHGANLQRLIAAKATYDPKNVFDFPQSLARATV